MLKSLVITLLAGLTVGCASSASTPPAPTELRPLMAAISERLDIANDVALSKFYSGKAVQDSERERQVIANAESQAALYGLDKEDVRLFMSAQIEANKRVQYARITDWQDHHTAPGQPTVTLSNGIRTRLDTLQPVMMQRYAAFKPWRSHSACGAWVENEIHRATTDPTLVIALQRATSVLCLSSPNA